jgi:putative endonuclease
MAMGRGKEREANVLSEQRLKDHAGGHGAEFIKDYGKFELVYSEQFATRADAMSRERQLKKWTRAKKEALIAGDTELLKRL